MRPTDAAVSHWEIPQATTSFRMGDSKRKGENQQNMAAGGFHLADVGKKLLKQPFFTTPSPAAVRLRGDITGASASPASPIANAGVQWDAAAESSGCRPPAVPSGEAKSTKEREGTKTIL